MNLKPTDPSLFFTRNDPQDPRLGEFVSSGDIQDIAAADWALWGYPDDEGIALNKGRVGAALAPASIRQYFYKMTPSLGHFPKGMDLGDYLPTMSPLSERHVRSSILAETCTRKNKRWISLGGGHDYGFADGSGFLKAMSDSKQMPWVINFDAHMDVRPFTNGFNSGTPFSRLLETFPQKFHFWEVGIQDQCNSMFHKKWAENRGAQIFSLLNADGSQRNWLEIFQKQSPPKGTPVWISLDIDSFTNMEAPGCSQAWGTGLKLEEFLPILTFLTKSYPVHGLSIYEVSPPLDFDNKTSKLAALILYHFLNVEQAWSLT